MFLPEKAQFDYLVSLPESADTGAVIDNAMKLIEDEYDNLKAIIKLEDVHFAQAINYLEAYDLEVGLLINFGAKSLEFKKLLNGEFKQKNQGNPKIIKNHSSDN
jgi:hypothetical protein